MTGTELHTVYKTKDGTIVPSVTTIIDKTLGWNKNALINWAKNSAIKGLDPDKIKRQAGDIGTLAHLIIESNLQDKPIDLLDWSVNTISIATLASDSFFRWWEEKKLELVYSEIPLVSETYLFGGTIDLVASNQYGTYLIDFKTSNNIYPEHKIQISAYNYLLNEVRGIQPDETYIIKLPKEAGSCEPYNVTKKETEMGFEIFKKLLEINDIRERLGW